MNQLVKKDYILVSIIGLSFGLLLLPVIKNIELSFFEFNLLYVSVLIVGFTIFANIALWIASLATRFIPIALQFAKFAAVGALNTLIYLGTINILIYFSKIASGYWYSIFAIIAFIIANTNAYFWNKYWTFKSSESATPKEFGQFLTVSIIGLIINAGIASLIVNFINPIGEMSPERWANIGALTATIISLIWNFIGYKFIVFKNKIV